MENNRRPPWHAGFLKARAARDYAQAAVRSLTAAKALAEDVPELAMPLDPLGRAIKEAQIFERRAALHYDQTVLAHGQQVDLGFEDATETLAETDADLAESGEALAALADRVPKGV